ncbi:hypothetical protein IJI28_02640 [Candidatus Saccharibacteria bacterium]|nr:hypothetical protein [Candidatus Saccharibacteria bacterium]
MEGANFFTVTPMSQRISLEAGKTVEGSISVINPNDSVDDLKYKAYVAPYSVVGEGYEADLTTDSKYNMIKDWITIENPTGTIEPNKTGEIKFKIKVPGSAPAGGQYAAIIITRDDDTTSSENGVAVKDIFEMASLIYANVNGETVHKGEILSNDIPGFVASAPITVGAMISNEGNTHENATVIIKATNFFTGDVIVEGDAEENYYSEIIMPDTTRYVTREISEGLPLLGIVKVEQTIYYQGSSDVASSNVIICPIWFLLLVFLTIGAIIASIVMMVKKHRKKAKWAE